MLLGQGAVMTYVVLVGAMMLGGYAMRIAYWSFVMLLFAVIFPFVLLYNFAKENET
jgi:hypothetical protein